MIVYAYFYAPRTGAFATQSGSSDAQIACEEADIELTH